MQFSINLLKILRDIQQVTYYKFLLFQDRLMMHLVQSEEELQQDLFTKVLALSNSVRASQCQRVQKKLQFFPNQAQEEKYLCQINEKQQLISQKAISNQKISCKKHRTQKNPSYNYKSRSSSDKNLKLTRSNSKIESQPVQLTKNQKKVNQVIAEFEHELNESDSFQNKTPQKKIKKLIRKGCKNIFKQKKFGKTLKISFPKKLVQMFINHYENYQIKNQNIKRYNGSLKQSFRQNKKNDFTFDKQVLDILGQNITKNEQEGFQVTQASRHNRKILSDIIRTTMKQQVIMRHKIAKNRQIYMIQLKVYALRCRSHILAKKGAFK